MKTWRLFLLAALAALGLQACDVRVNTGDTTVQEPQAALPEDTQLRAPSTTIAVAPQPQQPLAPAIPAEPAAAAEVPPTDAAPPLPVPSAPAEVAVQPETATLGAPAAKPEPVAAAPAPVSTPATATATAGSAAPTELQAFFEANAARLAAKR